ncbi:protein of unknown function [Aminobacter niigataensis]|nr:protein of unknown function [Aminobacter niigataensis]
MRRHHLHGRGRPREYGDLPLHRLPEADRHCISRDGSGRRGQDRVHGHTQDLREDRRERQQAGTRVCAECGSHLFATSVGDGPKVYGLRTGTSSQREQLVPRKQVWHRSALHWLPAFEGMETVEKQS